MSREMEARLNVAREVARYIVDSQCSIQTAAREFDIPYSTLRKYLKVLSTSENKSDNIIYERVEQMKNLYNWRCTQKIIPTVTSSKKKENPVYNDDNSTWSHIGNGIYKNNNLVD